MNMDPGWLAKEQYRAGIADGRAQVQPEYERRNGRLKEKKNKARAFLLTCGFGLLVGCAVGLLCSCDAEGTGNQVDAVADAGVPVADARPQDALQLRYVKTCQEQQAPWDGWSYSVCTERATDGEACLLTRYYLGTVDECWWGDWGLKEPATGYAVKECGDCAKIGGRVY